MEIKDKSVFLGLAIMTLPVLYLVWEVAANWTLDMFFAVGAVFYLLGAIIVSISQLVATNKKEEVNEE